MSVPTLQRVRPRDRKQRIEDAAALAFAERGYHQVSMSDVAGAVGISAPALYRHFPNKYALFAQAAFRTAHRLLDDTDAIATREYETAEQAASVLDHLVDAVIRTTIDLRAVGGLYRWEGRYLDDADRARMTGVFDTLRGRFLAAHAVYRPDCDDRETLVWAALSAIASITAHRTVVATATLRDVLRTVAWRLLDADLDAAATPEQTDGAPTASTRRRERLVTEAIAQFAARGYHDVTIEDIAGAVDLTPSGVYRHFEGKSAILLEACERAAARLDDGMRRARAAAGSPVETVRLVTRDYARHSVENHQLVRVYFADLGSLAPDEQRRLRSLQREYVAEWVELLQLARPEVTAREASVLVHAGFGVVADVDLLAHRRRADLSGQIARLLEIVLGID